MSLFLVNRYQGVEEDGSTSKESQSQALLAKLLQKAKEKQKRSSAEPGPDPCEEKTLKPKKKRSGDKKSRQEPQRHNKRKKEEAPVCELNSAKQGSSPSHQLPEAPLTGSDGQENTEAAAAENDLTSKQTTDTSSTPAGFTVLGGFENKPVQKIDRVLPQWLAQPDVILGDIKNHQVPISDIFQVCVPLVKKLQSNGIQHFFPVQAEVIPAILESMQPRLLIGCGGYKPRDICVSAPTGSGKTLAFVIPVIQTLMERVVCEVRALAVLPTKELAQQVSKVFTSYAEGTALKVVMLAGQRSFAAEQASLSEQRGGMRCSLADIVVTTPGRLVDHINKNSGLCLKHLRFLIIDEADRMIESMHQSWLDHVMRSVFKSGSQPKETSIFRRTEPEYVTAASLSPPQMPLQKLLFSATLTQNPEKLQLLGLHQPRLFSSIHRCSNITTTTTTTAVSNKQRFDFPQGLTEYYVPCTLSSKPLLILNFILRMKLSPILCFTNSRETAHRLFLLVKLFGGIGAAEFSSRLSPGERKKKLKEFEQGKIQLLVCTDAAARGIDINRVKCVVNYDAPQYIRTYIHRIGRTARAGKTGLAFTLLLQVQEKSFLQMVEEAGSRGIQKQIVKPENFQSMKARYEETLQELAMVIKDERVR